MTQYLLLIHTDEHAMAQAGPQVVARTLRRHEEFVAANASRLRGGKRLRPAATATTIRRDEQDRPVVTDGVFVESKEVLGGYYVIEAADLDEAVRVAAQVPAPFGGVEVRPVWPTDEP
ncbi:YciI family protein [Nocardia sp. CA-107356]|uniref:YciI family protein n=1 Tax=Nocardia sp. CA-107356 TaxID=3239972 RepID=UPI003D8D0027